jgi:hypothetical protein
MSGGARIGAVGLCAGCRHARQVPAGASLYWMCRRSLTDPGYEKYPRLPVLACSGHEPGEPGRSDEADPPDPHSS